MDFRLIRFYLGRFIVKMLKEPVETIRFILQKNFRKTLYERLFSYSNYINKTKLTPDEIQNIQDEVKTFTYNPKISILMPVYNTDLSWLKKAINSVEDQYYPHWELCIVDDNSTKTNIKPFLQNIVSSDPRIKVFFRDTNGHISRASNTALEHASGEFIALLDHDDILYPNSLYEAVKMLNQDPDLDFIYTDRDFITERDKRLEPFFKPDWSPDLLMANNYLTHLNVIRKSLVNQMGGFRAGYEGAQDYDLFLRVTEQTDKIGHIHKILYSWRMIEGSAAKDYENKPYANEAARKALFDALERRGLKGDIEDGPVGGDFRIRYALLGSPHVSIIIPTKDKVEFLIRCITSIMDKTTYPNFEIVIIDTGSKEQDTLDYYERLKEIPNINLFHWRDTFNYSSVNNYGVEKSQGEYLLFLNNDTEIVTPDWVEGMLEHAQREEIGAVGVKLLYPNDTVQHAGVAVGVGGAASNMFGAYPEAAKQYYKDVIRNSSAVTAACMMVRKEKFLEVSGFDETFRIAYNDVDFCLKLLEKGYFNLYQPYVVLYHHESISVGRPNESDRDLDEFELEQNTFMDKWRKYVDNDPYLNQNFSKSRLDFHV